MGSYLNPGSKGFVESLNSEIYVDKSLPIALKKRSKVVSEGNITFPEKENERIPAYRRDYERGGIVVFNNFTAEDTEIVTNGIWSGYRKILGDYGDGGIRTDLI